VTGSAGIVLAAGAGTRFGVPKAELVVDGKRLVDRAVRLLGAGGCSEVIAVVRAGTEVEDARVVVNPAPERGMSSSLRLGLEAAEGTAAESAVVVLVDMPGVTPTAVRRVTAAAAPVAMASYAGRRGHPVAFARSVWHDVAESAAGDAGARGFLAAHPELLTVVECPGVPVDLDTAADLAGWLAAR
jgi:CTP:molybdopterin cytidylyltransferase MocA